MLSRKPSYHEVLPTAKHEAGHWIIAKILNFEVGDIFLLFGTDGAKMGGSAIILSEDLADLSRCFDVVELRVKYLVSRQIIGAREVGMFNETLFDRYRETIGAVRHAAIAELLIILRNIKYGYCIDEVKAKEQIDELYVPIYEEARAHGVSIWGENFSILELNEDEFDNLSKYIFRRVKVLYAGAISESINMGKVNLEDARYCLQDGAKNDNEKIEELTRVLCLFRLKSDSVFSQIAAIDKLKEELWNETIALVEKDHVMIEGIGGRIAGDVAAYDQRHVMSAEELNILPSVKKRFS